MESLENIDKLEKNPPVKRDLKALSDKAYIEAISTPSIKTFQTASGKQIAEQSQYVEKVTGEKWFFKEGLDKLQKSVIKADYLTQKKQAEEQGFFRELGAFATQAVLGEVLLGTLEGAGYLLDFQRWGQMLSGQKQDIDNWFSNIMANAKQNLSEAVPIYEDPDNANRGFWDNLLYGDGWFASGAVSVASAASMLIPVAGWTRGASLLGKALSTGAKVATQGSRLSKIAKGAKTTIGSFADEAVEGLTKAAGVNKAPDWANKIGESLFGAYTSRHLESTMEAAGVYREKYQEYLDKGFTEQEAKNAASKGAEFVYNHDMALLLTDIPQFLIMGMKGWSPSKPITSMRLAAAEGKSKLGALAKASWSPITQFVTEGAEEATQFVIGEEGKYIADVHAGLKAPRDNSWGNMFKRNAHEAELWKSAFFGGFGGLVMGPAMRGSKNLWNKAFKEGHLSETAARIQEVQDRFTTIASNINAYKEAVAEGNERGAAVAKSRIAATTAINASNVGNFESMVSSLEKLKKATPEELEQFYDKGLDKNTLEDFKNNIEEFISEVKRVGELHENNMNRYSSKGYAGVKLANALTYTQAIKENFEKRESELETLIPQLTSQVTKNKALSSVGSSLFEIKLNNLVAKRVYTTAKKLSENAENEKDKEFWEKEGESILADINKNIETLKEFEEKGEALTIEDKRALAELENPQNIDLLKAHSEKEFLNRQILKYTEDLKQYEDILNEKLDPDTLNPETIVEPEYTGEDQEDAFEESSIVDLAQMSLENFEELDSKLKPILINNLIERVKNNSITLEEIVDPRIKDIIEEKLLKGTKEEITEEIEAQEPILEPLEIENISYSEEDGFETSLYEDSPIVEDNYITTQLTPLAWKSIHNNQASLDDLENINNVALSNLLENNFDVKDYSVKFELDTTYLKQDPELEAQVLEAIKLKTIPASLLGVVPIKAILYKNGKPLVMQVQDPKTKKTLAHEVYMHLHDDIFFLQGLNPEVAEQQKELLRSHKELILKNLMEGINTFSKLTDITDGNLNIQPGQDVSNSIEEVVNKKIENITLVYGQKDGRYYTEKNKSLTRFSSASPGGVYAIVNTNSGGLFPLKLKTTKLNKNEATLVYDLMVQELLSPKTLLSTELKNSIKNSDDPRINGISNYLNLNEITSDLLLDHLVFKGTKTKRNKEKQLIYGELNNIPGFTVGQLGARLTANNVKNTKLKQDIINFLTNNRARQIDINYLQNPEYKKYLNNTKLLSSNVAKAIEGPMFIQPVVSYSSNFTTKKDTNILKEFEAQVNKAELSKEELEALELQVSKNKGLINSEKENLLKIIKDKLANIPSIESEKEEKLTLIDSSLTTLASSLSNRLGVTMEIAKSQEDFEAGISSGQTALEQKDIKLNFINRFKKLNLIDSSREILDLIAFKEEQNNLIDELNKLYGLEIKELFKIESIQRPQFGQYKKYRNLNIITPIESAFEEIEKVRTNLDIKEDKFTMKEYLKSNKFKETFVSLQEAFNSNLYTEIFKEFNVNSVEDLNKLTPKELGELLMKICK